MLVNLTMCIKVFMMNTNSIAFAMNDCIIALFELHEYKCLSRGGRLKETFPALCTVSLAISILSTLSLYLSVLLVWLLMCVYKQVIAITQHEGLIAKVSLKCTGSLHWYQSLGTDFLS